MIKTSEKVAALNKKGSSPEKLGNAKYFFFWKFAFLQNVDAKCSTSEIVEAVQKQAISLF